MGWFVRNSIAPVKPKVGKVNLKTAAEAKKTAVKTAVKKAPAKTKAPAKPKK
jgi:hypothetical protein